MESCKLCKGRPCLNDGAACREGGACGSGLCFQGACVAECPPGFSPCKGSCRAERVLRYGEEYACEFECASLMGRDGSCIECVVDADCTRGLCNPELGRCVEYYNGTFRCDLAGEGFVPCEEAGRCVLPASKAHGQPYSCEVECLSGRGEDGVCALTREERFFVAGAVILVAILAFLSLFLGVKYALESHRLGPLKREAAGLRRALAEREEELRRAKVAKEELRKQLAQRITELKELLKVVAQREARARSRGASKRAPTEKE